MHRTLISLVALGLVACETVPATYDETLFETRFGTIEENPSVAAVDEALTELLARNDLTVDQRASALYLRAEKRFDGKYNVPGALEDYAAFTALVPEDPRLLNIERRRVFAATEIENAQRRLAQLQTLSAWFDDKVLMGDFADAAARYKTSGLTPTDQQLYLLREAGYVCDAAPDPEADPDLEVENDGATARVHRYGEVPDYAENAVWCETPSVS